MSYYTNNLTNPYSIQGNKKPRGGNNVTQNVTAPQGYYLGSASNIARLFILVVFLFTILFSFSFYYYGKELGRLEQKIDQLRIIPRMPGVKYEKVSKRA